MKLVFSALIVMVMVFHSQAYEDFESYRSCGISVLKCGRPFEIKHDLWNWDVEVTIRHFYELGSQEICRETTEVAECITAATSAPLCQNLPARYRNMYWEALNLQNLMCTEWLPEIEEHWECIFHPDFFASLKETCMEERFKDEPCEYQWSLRCVDSAINVISACNSGARALAKKIVTLGNRIPFALNCEGIYERDKPIPFPTPRHRPFFF